jgi:hypothetical protein
LRGVKNNVSEIGYVKLTQKNGLYDKFLINELAIILRVFECAVFKRYAVFIACLPRRGVAGAKT